MGGIAGQAGAVHPGNVVAEQRDRGSHRERETLPLGRESIQSECDRAQQGDQPIADHQGCDAPQQGIEPSVGPPRLDPPGGERGEVSSDHPAHVVAGGHFRLKVVVQGTELPLALAARRPGPSPVTVDSAEDILDIGGSSGRVWVCGTHSLSPL